MIVRARLPFTRGHVFVQEPVVSVGVPRLLADLQRAHRGRIVQTLLVAVAHLHPLFPRERDVAGKGNLGGREPGPEALPLADDGPVVVERVKVPRARVAEDGLGLVPQSPWSNNRNKFTCPSAQPTKGAKPVLTGHSEALVKEIGLERELVATSVGAHKVVGRYVVPVAKQACCFFLQERSSLSSNGLDLAKFVKGCLTTHKHRVGRCRPNMHETVHALHLDADTARVEHDGDVGHVKVV